MSRMARLADVNEVRCNSRVWFQPEYATFARCPNAAEFKVAFRNGAFPQWVCSDHVRWWAKSGLVLGRSPSQAPAFETDAMVLAWGDLEESEQAGASLRAAHLAAGHTVIYRGMLMRPDGTSEPFKPTS